MASVNEVPAKQTTIPNQVPNVTKLSKIMSHMPIQQEIQSMKNEIRKFLHLLQTYISSAQDNFRMFVYLCRSCRL